MQVIIDSKRHQRVNCPISFKAPKIIDNPILISSDGSQTIKAQSEIDGESCFIHAIIPYMDASTTTSYRLLVDSVEPLPTACPPCVQIKENGSSKLDVFIEDRFFTSYWYGPEHPKPFMGPIIGPEDDSFTRLDFDASEHPHHKSIWLSHGDVNGTDTWNEAPGQHGFEIHKSFTRVQGGAVYGVITGKTTWTDGSGNPLLDDTREFKIYSTPSNMRIVDVTLELKAVYGHVTLGPTKEAGPLAVRVADTMRGTTGGTLVNAYGGITEEECWGIRSPWCDYSGQVGNQIAGVAVFDNPKNIGYPSYWHIRDYGLMAVNNFYWAGAQDIRQNETTQFTYRMVFHSGNTADSRMIDRFHDYINPPLIKVEV